MLDSGAHRAGLTIARTSGRELPRDLASFGAGAHVTACAGASRAEPSRAEQI